MNLLVLVGRITADPKLTTTESGKKTSSFTIAVSRNYKNAQGEYETDFINCRVWGTQAETLKEYIHKGDTIGVKGSIQTRKYIKDDGTTKYLTEVSAESITFLQQSRKVEKPKEEPSDPFSEFGEQINIDDYFLE